MNVVINRLAFGVVLLLAFGALALAGVDLSSNTTAQMICAGLMLVGLVLAIIPDSRRRRP